MGLFSWLSNVVSSVTGNTPSCPPPVPVYKELCKDGTKRSEDLTQLNTDITKCTTKPELRTKSDFATNTYNIEQDIGMLKATIGDSLLMGDTIYGEYGIDDITKQVKSRNGELNTKRDTLKKEITKNQAIVERSDRDFSDLNDIPSDKKRLNVIEDYTLAFLCMAYIFMILALLYLYVARPYMTPPPSFSIMKLIEGIVGSTFITLIAFVLLYYFS